MQALQKRSIQINGHQTSISLEPEFWAVLQDMAAGDDKSLAALVAQLDDDRAALTMKRNLSSHLRVYILNRLKEGWQKATLNG